MVKIFLILILLVTLDAKTLNRMQVIMSTFVTISVDDRYSRYIEEAFKVVKDVESSISSYKPKSTVSLLNKNKHVYLDSYTYEALVLSEKYYIKSNGYFDITVGSITKDLYRFGKNEHLASTQELSSAKVDFGALCFDNKEASLDIGVKIDLGGMGKGFAVDKVIEYFKSNEVEGATVSASGDIRCMDKCNIEIQDPFSEGVLLSFKTTKKNLGISTSGTYNRYVKNQQNNHLINPKLKKPQTKFISITLVGETSNADLDAYATASSVMPVAEAYRFLDSVGVAYIVLESNGVLKSGGKLFLIVSDAIKK